MNRLQITKDSEKNILIKISPLKDKTSKGQFIFQIFGSIGLLIAIRQIFSDTESSGRVFLGVWIIFWTFMLIKLWNILKWRRFGKEIIKISGERITLIKTTFFIKIKEEMNIRNSKISINNYYIPISGDISKVDPGTLVIENKQEHKSVAIGKYLKEEEAKIIVDELKSYGIKNNNFRHGMINNDIDADDKYLKRYIKRVKMKIFLICLIPAFLYGYIRFKKDVNEYNLLKAKGKIAYVTSKFSIHNDSDYYYFYFIADNGQKIEASGRCKDKEQFDTFYKNLRVIYNPANPKHYLEYPYFRDYSVNYKIFFYLIVMTLFFAGFGSSVISFIYLVIKGKIKIMGNLNKLSQ